VAREPDTPDTSVIDANVAMPVWQLGDGWSNPEGGFRWIAPRATVRLDRPAGATHFELRVLANTTLLAAVGPVSVKVLLNQTELPAQRVDRPGWKTLEWDLAPAPAGSVEVTIETEPPFRPPGDPRTLGIAVGSLGLK